MIRERECGRLVGPILVLSALVCMLANLQLFSPDGHSLGYYHTTLQVWLMGGLIGGGLFVLCHETACFGQYDTMQSSVFYPAFGMVGPLYCVLVAAAGLAVGPKCRVAGGLWVYAYGHPLTDGQTVWDVCEYPEKAMKRHVFLFTLMLAMGLLQLLLCGLRVLSCQRLCSWLCRKLCRYLCRLCRKLCKCLAWCLSACYLCCRCCGDDEEDDDEEDEPDSEEDTPLNRRDGRRVDRVDRNRESSRDSVRTMEPRRRNIRTYQVVVHGLQGEEMIVDISNTEEQMQNMTVAELKEKIVQRMPGNLGAEAVRVIFTDRMLEESSRLSEYGIEHMSNLHVVLRVDGGPSAATANTITP